MNEERRKGDRRMPPAVAQHAIEERAALLAQVETLTEWYSNALDTIRALEADRGRIKRIADNYSALNMDAQAELAALKAKPRGVVLPEPFEMRPFQTVDQGSTNYKAGFNAAIRKVRENLNSPTVSSDDGMCNEENPENRCICREEFGHRVCVSAGVPDEFAKEVARIADDYHASNIEDADVALDEMREALNSALSMLAAQAPGKKEGE